MIHSGKYDENNADGIIISTRESGKNGIIVVDADYVIEDAQIEMITTADGSDTCDFSGKGTALAVFGERASVVLRYSHIETTGVATMPVFCDDGATVTIEDSELISNGGTLYDSYVNSPDQATMVAPPWILGIMGTSRCTNLMGNDSTMNVVDSYTAASNWAVLSTDSGSDMYLNIYNSTLELTGADESKTYGKAGFGGGLVNQDNPYTTRYGSGYGTYAIGNAVETFAGATVNVGTYATIFTGGTAKFTAIEADQTYNLVNSAGETTYTYRNWWSQGDITTTINSDTFGIMAHQGKNTLVMEKGTEMNSGYTSFLIKSGCSINATIDDTTITNGNNVLIQLMDNDDATTGMISFSEGFNRVHTENDLVSYDAQGKMSLNFNATGKTATNTASFTFTDGTYNGNIYNATGYEVNAVGGQTATALEVNLGRGATLNANVAPTASFHITYQGQQKLKEKYNGDAFINCSELKPATTAYREFKQFLADYQNTEFTISEYYDIGQVANMVNDNGNNTIAMSLTDDAKWNVEGDSYVTSLTLSGDAQVIIPAGTKLTVGDIVYSHPTQDLVLTAKTASSSKSDVFTFSDLTSFKVLKADGEANASGLATDIGTLYIEYTVKGSDKVYETVVSGDLASLLDENKNELVPEVSNHAMNIERDLLPAGTSTMYVVTSNTLAPDAALGSFSACVDFGYRAAYVIDNNKVDVANSVKVTDKTVKDVAIADVTGAINGATSGYSGVIVKNSSSTEQVKLDNLSVTLTTASDGKDVNDFAGYGAGVAVFDGSKVKLTNANIDVTGVGKLATFVDEGSDLIVTGSTLTSRGGTIYKDYKSTANQSYMIAPPWVLGISGTSRATNVMGKDTTATYVDSTVQAAGWAAVSTDSGSYMHVNVINSVVKIDSDLGTPALIELSTSDNAAKSYGYGAYVIGDTTVENFIGSSFQGGTYAIIMTGGTANLKSYTKGEQVIIDKLESGKHVTTVTADLTAETGNAAQTYDYNAKLAEYNKYLEEKAAYDEDIAAWTARYNKWKSENWGYVVIDGKITECDSKEKFDKDKDKDKDKLDGLGVIHENNEKDYVLATKDKKPVAPEVVTKPLNDVVPTTVSGTEFGFMFHANGSTNVNTLNLSAGTSINTNSTTFLMKKVNNTVNITGDVAVNPENGMILQVMDNDDDFVGAFMDPFFGMPTFNYVFDEQNGWSDTWGTEAKAGNYVDNLNVTGSNLTGDIMNATGYTASNPGAILNVNLTDATLTGAISTAAYQHTTKYFTYYDESKGYVESQVATAASLLGHVTNKPMASNGANGVNVTLTGKSVWTVDSYTNDDIYDTVQDMVLGEQNKTDNADSNLVAEAERTVQEFWINSLTISGDAKVFIPYGYTLHIGGETWTSDTPEGLTLTAKADGSAQVYGTVAEPAEGGESGGMPGGPGGPGGEQPGETPETPDAPETPDEGGEGEMPGGPGGGMPGMGGDSAAFPAISWAIVSGDDIISLTENEDGTATVTGLKAGTATVVATANGENGVLGTSAEFTITVSEPEPEPAPVFTFSDDAQIGAWASEAVYALYDMGIVTGYANGDGTFAFQPAGAITRAEVAVILYRMAGTPETTGTNPFTDATAAWYQDAIKWAAAEGVVTGRDATTFDPNANVTRQELVTMLYRAAGQPAANADLTIYHDADQIAAYAVPAMTWAVDQGVVGGYEDSTLRPAGTATRQEFATIAYRFITAE